MISHNNLVQNVISMRNFAPFATWWKSLSFLPLNHIFERMVSYLYLFRGTSIYYAESLDTIGLLTRNIEDIALFKNVLTNRRPDTNLGTITPPRIGLCRTHLWPQASPASHAAVESAANALSKAGAHVTEFELPATLKDLGPARVIINNVERAHAGAWEWNNGRPLLSHQMVACIESGLATSHVDYLEAVRLCEPSRLELDLAFQSIDALLTPSVSGEAPEGLGNTGDSTFQSLWTMLHVPALTLPTHKGPTNLPIGVQLIGPRFHDDQLLRIAQWAWQHLGDQTAP